MPNPTGSASRGSTLRMTWKLEAPPSFGNFPFVMGVMGDFSGDPTAPLQSAVGTASSMQILDRNFLQRCRGAHEPRPEPEGRQQAQRRRRPNGGRPEVPAASRILRPARVAEQVPALRVDGDAGRPCRDLHHEQGRSVGRAGRPALKKVARMRTNLWRCTASLASKRRRADHVVARRPTAARPPARKPPKAYPYSDQVIGANKADDAGSNPGPDEEPGRGRRCRSTVTFDKNLSRTFEVSTIQAIDAKLSDQLNAIMHDPEVPEAGRHLARDALSRDEQRDQHVAEDPAAQRAEARSVPGSAARCGRSTKASCSRRFYENEFRHAGGDPYAALLIGDNEWTQHPDDIETLRLVSNVAAAAFAPFISAAGPGMFGFDSYTELADRAILGEDLPVTSDYG